MPRPIAIALLTSVALLAAATIAPAAEAPTRDEYVDQLEKVCEPDQLAIQRTMKGSRADIQGERFKVAARKFGKASSIFDSTMREIKPMPRPPGDTARLAKWFTYLTSQQSYMHQIVAQLRRENAIKAQRLTARFIHVGNLANNVVLAFGFNWCTFKFSRYG
jgi:hypothetical protein